MSHNSTNYKIKKYQYKLDHATNKKEAASYKAKLASYKTKQAGGEIKEEEIREMINKAFTGSEEKVGNLAAQFDSLIEEIRKKCCEKKDCGPETLAQIAKLEEDWRLILNRELLNKDRELGKKLTEQRKTLEEKLKIDCPPNQVVAPLIVDEDRQQLLLSAQKTKSDLIPPLPEFTEQVAISAEASAVEQPSIPTAIGELGDEAAQKELKGGKRRRKPVKK